MPERVKRLVFAEATRYAYALPFSSISSRRLRKDTYTSCITSLLSAAVPRILKTVKYTAFFCKVVKFVEISGFTLFQPFYERVYFFVHLFRSVINYI